MTLYITANELRERLSSDSSFSQDITPEYEEFLTLCCTNATAIVNVYLSEDRPFAFETIGSVTSPRTRTYTGEGTDVLYLDLPLQTLVSGTNDGEAVTSADVWLEPINDTIKTAIRFRDDSEAWCSDRYSVTISGVWGWGNPPAEAIECAAQIAVRLVKGRAAGYSDTVGVDLGSGDLVQRYAKALPPLIRDLLDRLRERYHLPTPETRSFGVH